MALQISASTSSSLARLASSQSAAQSRLRGSSPAFIPLRVSDDGATFATAALPPSSPVAKPAVNGAASSTSPSPSSQWPKPSEPVPYVPAYSLQQPKLPAGLPVTFAAASRLEQLLTEGKAWAQKLHPALAVAWACTAVLTAFSVVSTVWNVLLQSAAVAHLRAFPILAVSVLLPICAIVLPYQPILVKRLVIGLCGYAVLGSVEALVSSAPLTAFALPPFLALILAISAAAATVAYADSYEKAQLAEAKANSA